MFAGVADREMPCRIAGCENTWTWYGTQQIRSLGKPPPKRMCQEHLASFEGIEDKQIPCRNSWCTNTWLWTRGAQLHLRERHGKLKTPHRLCEECFAQEKATQDREVECKIPECKNTWTWARGAQLRHRAWVKRQQAKLQAEEAEEARAAAGEQAKTAAPKRAASEAAKAEGAPAESEAAKAESAPAEDAASEAAKAEGTPTEGAAGEAAQAEGTSIEGAAGEAAKVEGAPTEGAAGEAAKVEGAPTEGATSDAKGEDAAAASAASPPSGEGEGEAARRESKSSKKRRRRRKRRRKIHEGPPEKLCERCFERLGHLEPIEIPCKVHGCTNHWKWEREGQLRAWAALDGKETVTELPQPPRRMCNSCFEFVRAHPDRQVVCGRPGCDKTWTYKTGAQLQDFLAGRTQDPIRLCEDCSRSQFVVSSVRGVQMPPEAELMPCQVSGCSGTWVYDPTMKLSPADPEASEPPVDRMCDACRQARGADPRDPRGGHAVGEPASTEPASSAEPNAEPASSGADDSNEAVTQQDREPRSPDEETSAGQPAESS